MLLKKQLLQSILVLLRLSKQLEKLRLLVILMALLVWLVLHRCLHLLLHLLLNILDLLLLDSELLLDYLELPALAIC